jgi:RND family efflux transporter MFP subunit
MAADSNRSPHRALAWFGVIAVLLALTGIAHRVVAERKLRNATDNAALPVVSVILPRQGPANEDLVLPGNVQAWHEAPIYARTNGYLKAWHVDLGAEVKKGDLLAEIETPEVDAQLRQAEADLKTAQANNDLAQVTAERWKELLKTDSVARQDADEKTSAAAAGAAALASAKANRDRLRDMEGFKRVVAPFDGRITARNTDVGALISAGSGQELFHIVDSRNLRVYVQVPQNQAWALTPSMTAVLKFTDKPGRTFTATLDSTASAINPSTRTLLAQFVADNSAGELLPGGYAEVHLAIPAAPGVLRVPVGTLVFRAAGLQLATVDAQNHAHLQAVTMGRDFGNEVEITSGLTPESRIIVNPPDALVNGQEVKAVTAKAPSPTAPAGGAAGSPSPTTPRTT